MSWIPLKLSKKKKAEANNSERSEEVSDIIDRMPTSFGNWVATAVVIFTCLLFFFGWIIKYPDVVAGKIKINSNLTPVKLVANSSGKMHLNGYKAQDYVKEGEYLAVIQNPAKTEDIRLVWDLLSTFDPNDDSSLFESQRIFPEKVSLGELNLKYYTFLSALKSECDYKEENIFEKRKISLLDNIKWRKIILQEAEEILQITEDNVEVVQKWHDKYASLQKDMVATYEYEVDRSKMEYFSAQQSMQNLRKEAASIQMQIADSENQLAQLSVEKREKERQLQLELLSSFHDLTDNIKSWESKYVLKAPFNGKLEFLNFWVEDQFVQAGEDMFSVVPEETTIIGQMLLPANGAGKVKIGDEVIIKLDNYPFREFGSIDGVVKYISLITGEYQEGNNKINTYLVSVDMPEGLTSNYGEVLDFKYEIEGVGEIIVKKRRLIERLFDNLKSRTK